MFKSALLFRITHWEPGAYAAAEERLSAARFAECGATQPESVGWVEPRGEKQGALMESVGGQLILRLCVERKAVPSSVIKTQLEQRLDKVEAETGRRPKGKRAKEFKEEIVQDLLPRAFPKRATSLVWIDGHAGLVVVSGGSYKSADRVVTALIEALGGGLTLRPINTKTAPATAMAHWLSTKEAPHNFTIDRECELKQPDSEKSTVRYARHTLDIDEVGEHIKQGKLPTQVALTWAGRVSFVLSESLAIKKIKLLDVVLEGTPQGGDAGFDTDVAITTGELGQLIPDLLLALDGELPIDQPLPDAPKSEPLAA